MLIMVPDRRLVLLLAAHADCNPRTARRSLVEGVDAIKGANLRDRLREALGLISEGLGSEIHRGDK